MEVQHKRLSLSDLRHPEKNPRTISRSRLEDLKRNMIADPDFIEVRPLIVNMQKGREGVIVGGNMRYEAAKALGWSEIPCVIIKVQQAREAAWIAKDNAHHGEWNKDELAEMIFQSLEDMEHALPSDELDEILNNYGPDAQKDEEQQVEEIAAQKNHISKLGDVWQLGEHILVCGDSTDSKTLAKVMGADEKAAMAFTDPPYNVDQVGGDTTKTKKQRLQKGNQKIKNDRMDDRAWAEFVRAWMRSIYERTAGSVYICMSTKEWPSVQSAFVEAGFHWSDTIIWVKDRLVPGRADYQRQYEPILVGKPAARGKIKSAPMEPILYGWPNGVKREWNGGRDEGDAWFFRRPGTNPIHPTMKPVELVCRAIANSSNRGDTVLDIFGGGGSTLIACERLDRKARIVELDPGFCDAIIGRWAGHTKRKDVVRNGKKCDWGGAIITLEGVHESL